MLGHVTYGFRMVATFCCGTLYACLLALQIGTMYAFNSHTYHYDTFSAAMSNSFSAWCAGAAILVSVLITVLFALSLEPGAFWFALGGWATIGVSRFWGQLPPHESTAWRFGVAAVMLVFVLAAVAAMRQNRQARAHVGAR